MVCTLTACGGSSEQPAAEPAPAEETVTSEPTEEPAAEEPAEEEPAAEEPAAAVDASIDFEDGLYGFVGLDSVINPAADASTFEVVDGENGKELKITRSSDKSAFIAIAADQLLGDKIGSLASADFTIGLHAPSGNFSAASGAIYYVIGGEFTKASDWSVYLESSNPKTYTADAPAALGEGDYIVVSLESDTSSEQQGFCIDNILFKDAGGAKLDVDTSAVYVAAAGNTVDRSNLWTLTGATELEGFAVTGDAWSQNGIELTEDQIALLKPGTAVEISYTSETGNMWLVMPGAEAGWMRVGVGDTDGSGQQYAYVNNSGNTAQVTYEQLAAVCGDDPATWGAMMQCESDGAWEVYSVKIGNASAPVAVSGGTELEGFAVTGDAWSQNGIELTDDQFALLQPGTALEISYTSETGEIWIVMPGAEAGWMRVGVGDYDGSGQGYAVFDGSKCYITYEMIAEYCGDDPATWGKMIQCEASSAWEVYSVKVGKAVGFTPNNSRTVIDGFAVTGDGWGQNGVELTEEQKALLVPGSVINISYTSETGEIWIVMPGAEAGWMRVGVGDFDGSGQGYAAYDGSFAQVTYEQIAEYCGDDPATWGAMIQCEASSAWEVYELSIGTTK